jgi:hypothetical protein
VVAAHRIHRPVEVSHSRGVVLPSGSHPSQVAHQRTSRTMAAAVFGEPADLERIAKGRVRSSVRESLCPAQEVEDEDDEQNDHEDPDHSITCSCDGERHVFLLRASFWEPADLSRHGAAISAWRQRPPPLSASACLLRLGGRRGNLSVGPRKICPPRVCRCAGRPSSATPDLPVSISSRERIANQPAGCGCG